MYPCVIQIPMKKVFRNYKFTFKVDFKKQVGKDSANELKEVIIKVAKETEIVSNLMATTDEALAIQKLVKHSVKVNEVDRALFKDKTDVIY